MLDEALQNQIKWDLRYLHLAREVASWSKDPSTKTGAVVVNGKREFLGYNGFPIGMRDDAELYEDRAAKYSRVIHCEMNAIIKAGEHAVNATLYTWPFMSCDRCAAHMVQAGIQRCVAPALPKELEERWKANLELSKGYFAEAGVELVEYVIDFTDPYWSR